MKLKFRKVLDVLPFGFLFIWLVLWAYNVYSHFEPPSNQSRLQLIENSDNCDLQKESCIAELPSGTRFEINLEPKPILSNKITKVSLKIIEGPDIPISIDINGVDMDMGYNRPDLKQLDSGKFESSFLIPTCSTAKFDWKAVLIFKNKENELSGFPFVFQVNKK